MSETKCIKVNFKGAVQGVGFRFTVQRLASNYNIGGFVRNEPDGSVLVVAEGEESVINSFIADIESSSIGGYISSKSVEEEPATGRYSGGFEIKYWH